MTYARPLTHRIPVDSTSFERLRCVAGWHPWARWELLSATVTAGKTKREIMVNVRECICCGLSQQKLM